MGIKKIIKIQIAKIKETNKSVAETMRENDDFIKKQNAYLNSRKRRVRRVKKN